MTWGVEMKADDVRGWMALLEPADVVPGAHASEWA
jgi:hypothetical protein